MKGLRFMFVDFLNHYGIWLWRIVPTGAFLSLAVPLYVRAVRGVIPRDPAEGFPEAIYRRDQPGIYWRWMSLYLLIAIALTVWVVLAWYFPLPKPGTDSDTTINW